MNKELLSKIKKINIFTKRLVRTSLFGDYKSAFRGSGMEFEQLREYVRGDEVRFIDWNSSLKTDSLMIKQFTQERDRALILMIDISKSMHFCSSNISKGEYVLEVAAALAFLALNSKDKVGLILFSDKVDKWIPPAKSINHINKILDAIIGTKSDATHTKIEEALKFLISLKIKNSIVFMMSDWIENSSNYSKFLKIAKLKHECIAIRFLDKVEKFFPKIGLLEVQDIESGKKIIIDTRTAKTNKANAINFLLEDRLGQQRNLFAKNKIGLLDLDVEQSFIGPLINFLHQRSNRSI